MGSGCNKFYPDDSEWEQTKATIPFEQGCRVFEQREEVENFKGKEFTGYLFNEKNYVENSELTKETPSLCPSTAIILEIGGEIKRVSLSGKIISPAEWEGIKTQFQEINQNLLSPNFADIIKNVNDQIVHHILTGRQNLVQQIRKDLASDGNLITKEDKLFIEQLVQCGHGNPLVDCYGIYDQEDIDDYRERRVYEDEWD